MIFSLLPQECDSVSNSHSVRLKYSALLIAWLVSLPGCASNQYQYGTAAKYHVSQELAARTDVQIERGRPQVVIDSLGWVWGIPDKILLWDRRVLNHRIDEDTEAALAEYLACNELSSVKVRLNQYRPGDDWKRLAANKAVAPGWRYTVGALSILGETVFPGRVFGADHYNPYSNTIHLYSNAPAIALHEAGHAKDYAYRKWKGTYAFSRVLPVLPLVQEAIATSDALSYMKAHHGLKAQQEGYELLYPAYGSYIGSEMTRFLPAGQLVGLLGGHVAGRWRSWRLEKESADAHERFQYQQQLSSDAGELRSDAPGEPAPEHTTQQEQSNL